MIKCFCYFLRLKEGLKLIGNSFSNEEIRIITIPQGLCTQEFSDNEILIVWDFYYGDDHDNIIEIQKPGIFFVYGQRMKKCVLGVEEAGILQRHFAMLKEWGEVKEIEIKDYSRGLLKKHGITI